MHSAASLDFASGWHAWRSVLHFQPAWEARKTSGQPRDLRDPGCRGLTYGLSHGCQAWIGVSESEPEAHVAALEALEAGSGSRNPGAPEISATAKGLASEEGRSSRAISSSGAVESLRAREGGPSKGTAGANLSSNPRARGRPFSPRQNASASNGAAAPRAILAKPGRIIPAQSVGNRARVHESASHGAKNPGGWRTPMPPGA